MNHRWTIISAVVLVSFASGGFLLERSATPGDPTFEESLFEKVRSHVSHYYVDSLSDSELYRKAADGMLVELKDPYSELLTGDDFKALTEQTTGNYAGLGIQIDVRDGWITIVAPLPDTPAERAGLESGDQIIEVDGESTEGWSSEKAVSTLRGEPRSKVKIVVRRPGVSATIPFELSRARIHQRSVPEGTLYEGGIGVIELNPVAETSARELREEVERMRRRGMRELILDLRRNPGGLLTQGVAVADLFLDPGDEIVSTRGRAPSSTRTFTDEAPQPWPDLPVVVLVNYYSASAAEIIAGALQDHDRAVVVGMPTFGKGLVQTLYELDKGVALKLTTARWFTPSGRTIQREGDTDELELVAMADSAGEADSTISKRPIFHTDAGRVVRGGGGIVPDVVVRPDTLTVSERAFIDQLGDKVADYRDVLVTYALEAKGANNISAEDFEVTPAMTAEVLRRLRAKGVTMSDTVFSGGESLVKSHVGYEIARYVFGRTGELRRRAADDLQLQRAIALLREADSPAELMTHATASAAERSSR